VPVGFLEKYGVASRITSGISGIAVVIQVAMRIPRAVP
jgi:hypothetical protein